MAGTEQGVTEPEATFSACFGVTYSWPFACLTILFLLAWQTDQMPVMPQVDLAGLSWHFGMQVAHFSCGTL